LPALPKPKTLKAKGKKVEYLRDQKSKSPSEKDFETNQFKQKIFQSMGEIINQK